MIAGYYCRQQDSGLNYIIQTLVFQRCWSIFDSLCRLACLWIKFHDWQRLLCRVEWASICGKLIQLLKFNFLLSVRSPFVWFSFGTSKFDFGPNFLREFCKENDSFDKLEWNKRLLYVSSMLIIDLVFLLMFLYLFQHLLYSENYIKNEFSNKLSFIKKVQPKHL